MLCNLKRFPFPLSLPPVFDCFEFTRHIVPLDYIWIPASAFIIQRMYRAPLLSSVGFVEQAIPGIEFIPTATLGWMLETYPELRKLTRALPLMGRLSSRFKKG
ncbi:unnamed protein product [Closterium sp. Yama58-4]|nr:unnamed protein product [Closterium sp. Yama58-4]